MASISDLERGVHRMPKLYTGHLLADAVGLIGADRVAFELGPVTLPGRTTATTGLPTP